MPHFEVERYVLAVETYRCEAKNEAEAIKKVLNDEARQIGEHPELLGEPVLDIGLPECELDREMIKELGSEYTEGWGVPQIRSIRNLDEA